MNNDNTSSRKIYQEYWDIVEDLLSEGSMSGYKMAIIETENILSMALEDKRIPGKNNSEKIQNTEFLIENPDKLKYSRAMRKNIISEAGFDVSSEDTKEIISGYYKAIMDIANKDSNKFGIKEKTLLFLERWLGNFSKIIKRAIILVVLFFLTVFILSETTIGKSFSSSTAELTRYIFYKVLPILITAAIIILILIGIIYYWKNKKKR